MAYGANVVARSRAPNRVEDARHQEAEPENDFYRKRARYLRLRTYMAEAGSADVRRPVDGSFGAQGSGTRTTEVVAGHGFFTAGWTVHFPSLFSAIFG